MRFKSLMLPLCGVLVSSFIFKTEDADAKTVSWVSCADEYKTCTLPTGGSYTIMYGYEDDNGSAYVFTQISGTTTWPCRNVTANPVYGQKKKKCWYQEAEIDKIADSWTLCAGQGSECDTGSDDPQLIRVKRKNSTYGNSWYTIVRSGKFTCSKSSYFRDGDVVSCYLGGPVAPGNIAADDFIDCAAQDQVCDLSSAQSSMVLLRFGVDDKDKGSKWVYHLVYATSIACNDDTLTNPLKGKRKTCQYVPYYELETSGLWTQVNSCATTGCSIDLTLSYGTSSTHSVATTDSFSETFTVAVEAGFEVEPYSGKISASSATQWANSTTVQDALQTTSGVSVSTNCGTNPGGKVAELWQFSMPTTQDCHIWDCGTASVTTAGYACVFRDPNDPDYQGPRCLPNNCKNEDCSECIVDEG